MKQLLTILFAFLSFASYAQFPVTHGQSNSHTKEKFEGAIYPVKGLINGRYADTATANLDYIAGEPGGQIIVGNTIWVRDSTTTKWIVAGGYGVIASNITILNDSSISICNGITCDTFSFTNIVVNNFSVVNDSTILVCDGNNVCDTLFIPPTPISKNFVDSTKIIDGVIYYYINGNAYSGGAVTGTSQYQWSVLDSLNNVISPQQGDVYLVSTSPSGSFVGHENQIAQYDTTAGFTFTAPNVGDLLYNSTTYQVSKWTGTAWVLQPPPLVENWWSRVAWNGAPGQYIQTGAKNSYLTMFGSLNGTNTGLGRQVFTDNPTGGDGGNTAIGSTSQFHIRAGAYNNTSVGNYSLWYHVSGHDQVAIGYNAASTGDKVFSIGLGTNAPNNNNTFSISDSTTHLYMKLDSASGVAPSVVGKDANGNWHTYQTPSGSSGSVLWGDITGSLPDQTDLLDSLNNKVNKTDRFPLNVVKPILAIDSVTIGFDSLNLTELRYSLSTRDTTNWTDTTLIDKKYFNDRLASYSPGGSGTGISHVIGTNGVENVNDSTVQLDTAYAKNIFYNKNSVDSALALKQTTLVPGTNIKTINGNSILGSGDLTITGGTHEVKQEYTGSSSVTVADSTTWLIINPAAIASAITITMPANPTDKQLITISFGGTITSGNGVVATLTVSPNTGQSIIQASTPSYVQSGESISYRYNISNTSYYRIN